MTGDDSSAPDFLDLVPDREGGPERLLLGIRRFDEPFLLTVSLSQGVGSSELWLDRGRAGKARLAEFRRANRRVLLVVLNKHFLTSGDAAAVRAGQESFAVSVVWSGPVLREEEGTVVVDATGLVLYDHDRVAGHLEDEGQGEYALDAATSLPLLADSRTGPAATRLPALLTFRGPGRGAALRAVAADPRAVSVVQQLNLLRLPESPLPARRYHPASGGYGIGYADHGLAGRADIQVKVQPRFRAEPGGAGVVFRVDPAIPEPFRTAVVEGGNWWREAFARTGLPDAYRVEAAGPDFDPYDPAVNGVVWVHRSGRGWSLGQGLTDPRTGEILHARVRLGSQRVDQVRALGEALLAPYGRPDEAERLAAVEELVLARLRLLAAHEIGHALGFMHNFASTRHPAPSVMDYPHPRVTVTDTGELDLAHAYATGLGPWDHFLVAHAYGHFADEERELAGLRRAAAEAGLVYVSDEDAQGTSAAHPDGVPWVTGGDALQALETVLRVRRIALEGFSRGVLPPGRQTGELEERAVLLHLLHRHEVTAVARLVGGVRYGYAQAGDDAPGGEPVDAGTQHTALNRLAALLRTDRLGLPQAVLDVITPPAIRYVRTDQYFDTGTGRLPDPFEAVRTAVTLVTRELLDPARLGRVAWQHAADPAMPGARDVVDALLEATWLSDEEHRAAEVPGRPGVRDTADWTVLNHLLTALDTPGLPAPVRATLKAALRALAVRLRERGGEQRVEAAELIASYLADPRSVRLDPLPRVPPGAPN
ncbi:Matrixin [Streptomyces cellostaticus]|uniref:Matrixin n=2 Tax=Streptomyces cellostaticus TaxID=67285 RepID=A0A117PWJ1_9ACTN|nr:zinc-dependent metalloprotease [Streptomyces cellostaticus]KUM95313.1 Matrixin [Streptomyces cellostaticus]GHI01841.1 periplasmic metalloprotease [Streptomyces cellostaticus]